MSFFQHFDDDEIVGDEASIYTENPAAGLLRYLDGIWTTIQTTFDDYMNDMFINDETEAKTAYNTITYEYAHLLTDHYNCGDDKSCSELTPTKKARPVRDATFTSDTIESGDDDGSEAVDTSMAQPPLTTAEYERIIKSKSVLHSSSNSPPPRAFGLTMSGYSTLPLPRKSPGAKLYSGATQATSASKSIIAQAFEEESIEDQRELEDVATAILSQVFRQQKMNVGELLTGGNATKVYKLIADTLYRQKVAIDVRNGATRGKGNEWQMKEVWGKRITNYAKSARGICYLCGGQIVPSIPRGGQPEMEHKLPCAVFYAKFAFIYSCFSNELTAWRAYVANLRDENPLMNYYIRMNSSEGRFNTDELSRMYADIRHDFTNSLDGRNFVEMNLTLFTDFILPAYLSEFAYSHHLCNQVKSNYDLGTEGNSTDYYKGLVAILNGPSGCNTDADTILRPACIDIDFCNAERTAILTGLGTLKNRALRKDNVQAQMGYLNYFANEYAAKSNYTEKRMILHTIKETIRAMKVPIASGEVTKGAVKQMNAQARITAQGLDPITGDAVNFLKQLSKDNITGLESDRLKDKAQDRIKIYLDRIHQIFENVYGTPEDIKRQLNNKYVSPAIKIQIYNNTHKYYDVLNSILDNINVKIRRLNMVLYEEYKDDRQMLNECKSFVDTLEDILERYNTKISELRDQSSLGTIRAANTGSSTSTNRSLNKVSLKYDSDPRPRTGVPMPTPRPTLPYARKVGALGVLDGPGWRENIEEDRLKLVKAQKLMPETEKQSAKRNAEAQKSNKIVKKRRNSAIMPTHQEGQLLEAEKREALKQKAKQKTRERDEKRLALEDDNLADNLGGGRRQKVRKTRKLKRRPRKTTKRVGRRKRTIKRKSRSRKKTIRRR